MTNSEQIVFALVYSVLHRTLQVWFFLNFCTICKYTKLKYGKDDLQFLHNDILKAKNNNSAAVSVMTIFIVISNMFKMCEFF